MKMATCKFKNIQVCRMILNDNFAMFICKYFFDTLCKDNLELFVIKFQNPQAMCFQLKKSKALKIQFYFFPS